MQCSYECESCSARVRFGLAHLEERVGREVSRDLRGRPDIRYRGVLAEEELPEQYDPGLARCAKHKNLIACHLMLLFGGVLFRFRFGSTLTLPRKN